MTMVLVTLMDSKEGLTLLQSSTQIQLHLLRCFGGKEGLSAQFRLLFAYWSTVGIAEKCSVQVFLFKTVYDCFAL